MSVRHSEYAPVPGDLYCTPPWVTEALLSAEKFQGSTLEPAMGRGHMARVLASKGLDVSGGDVSDGYDFLITKQPYQNIITNPPYSNGLAEKFVRHALELTKPVRGKVAMLLPLAWDSAKGRRDLFADHPAFKAKYTLTKRIRWENLEQKKNGPSQNHAWFVWQWGWNQRPVMGWLP